MLKTSSHENIVNGIDCFYDSEKKRQIIIMEYCDYGDVARLIKHFKTKEERFPEEQVIKLIIQVAKGLKYIHERKTAHLDLKPQNLLLTRHGVIKICDFGLAQNTEL